MATFVILKFPTAGGAQRTLRTLQNFQEQRMIQIDDGAILTWPPGARYSRTELLSDLTRVRTLGVGFWEMLFGLLFAIPFFGAAAETAIGVLVGHFVRCGIDEDFLKRAHNHITEDTSALFLLTNEAVLDCIADVIRGSPYELISTNLSYEQQTRLREVFDQESLVY
jgi:uncharacterized membrane protein